MKFAEEELFWNDLYQGYKCMYITVQARPNGANSPFREEMSKWELLLAFSYVLAEKISGSAELST